MSTNIAQKLTQREKRLKEQSTKCPKSKFYRICLKESFQREKKDKKNLFYDFMQSDLPLGYTPYEAMATDQPDTTSTVRTSTSYRSTAL
jgi:hypothetical protein